MCLEHLLDFKVLHMLEQPVSNLRIDILKWDCLKINQMLTLAFHMWPMNLHTCKSFEILIVMMTIGRLGVPDLRFECATFCRIDLLPDH